MKAATLNPCLIAVTVAPGLAVRTGRVGDSKLRLCGNMLEKRHFL